MDEDIYDEFGNLIDASGQTGSDSEDEYGNIPTFNFNGQGQDEGDSDDEDADGDASMKDSEHGQIVLHENKQYYPSVSDVYGPDVETIVATVDAQDISEPIVAPEIEKKFKIEESELPITTYSKDYLWDISNIPSKVRNVALCGNLHSGKTSILDMFVLETHELKENATLQKSFQPLRYTDNHKVEMERGVSIKSSVMTLLLPNLKGNSVVTHIVDTPGHVNFVDELAVATRLADTCALVVDVVEGLTVGLQLAIEHALKTNTPMNLIINKIDRLIIELRLPPNDAYFKIRRTIEEINEFIKKSVFLSDSYTHNSRLSPELGNVCFSSSSLGICFSLNSFALKYVNRYNMKVDVDQLSSRLWGDVYYIQSTGSFSTKNPGNLFRSFVKFILEPIYKIVSHTLTKEPQELNDFLKNSLNITSIKKKTLTLDSQILLKIVFQEFFGTASSAFVDMLEKTAPSPQDNAEAKFSSLYTGPKTKNEVYEAIKKCDPEGALVAQVVRLVDTKDGARFYAQVRVLSGTLKPQTRVHLLGESYSEEYDEDEKDQDIRKTFFSCGRYRIPVNGIPAGSIGLISGHDIDVFITKTATIYDENIEDQLYIIRPLDKMSIPVFKIAVQPFNPSELSKFVDGLKKLNRGYIGCEVRVEEGGEYVIFGYGELYMDCLLHDLKHLYSEIEIKVSDPMTRFSETCVDSTMVKIPIKSGNKKNKITIVAEPLQKEIAQDIDNGKISSEETSRTIAKFFRSQYNWDSLAARSVWTFGPDDNGVNILIDETLPDEVDRKRLALVKESIKQGFKWATREGPLCEEPMRDVLFKISGLELAASLMDSNGAQIIQMCRNACYAAFMLATPRLLEPFYEVEIVCYSNVVDKLSDFLDKRRGSILTNNPIDGTQLYKVKATVPVMDSVGLETDIRLLTQGQAMCLMTFSKWQVVPGDPMDKDAFIPVLRPAPYRSLARDFVLKTRRRKGLDGENEIQKYLEPEVYEKLKATGIFD